MFEIYLDYPLDLIIILNAFRIRQYLPSLGRSHQLPVTLLLDLHPQNPHSI